ncbi:MAG TPA: hypothetical protein VG452_12550 [Egibacteraceae bacterium]|nr:hypothetical protein [Egibacteraceae bacterium]
MAEHDRAVGEPGRPEGPAAALDRLDEPDETYQRYLSDLHRIEREAIDGRLQPAERERRREETLSALGQHVMDRHPSPHARLFAGIDLEPELFPKDLYIPSDARPSWVPREQRYSLEWTSADAPGLAQSKWASAATGRLHVINLVPSNTSAAGGHAQAAVGIEVRPKHQLSRLTLRPELSYTWGYHLDTPVVGSNVPWSRVWTHGQLRLVAQRQDPVDGTFETYLQRRIGLWSRSMTEGSQMSRVSESGPYPSSDPGLIFIGSSGSNFALWVIATAYVSKDDRDPDPKNRSVCQANLDVEVPVMSVEEVSLT